MSAPPPPARRILLPIRLRLALWYSLLLAVVLTLVSLLVYNNITSNLWQQVDQSLQDRAATIAAQSRVALRPSPSGPVLSVDLPAPQNLSTSDIFVQIMRLDGSVVRASDNLAGVELPKGAAVTDVGAGSPPQYDTVTLSDQRLRIYCAPLQAGGQPVALIEVARLLNTYDQTASSLSLQLGVGSGLALLVALALGWLVSGQALRPLERVSRTAERIGQERDFGRRVPYRGPNDEVGRLAATFNTMLDRLQGSFADTQEAARRLEAALAAQKRFVGDASHELRTPLTAIRGNAELMQRIPNMTATDRQESIAEIASEAQRMSRLVDDLLALARADAGHHLRKEPVTLAPLVRGAYAAARHLPGGVRLALEEPLPDATVVGDSDSLKQLLLILLDNACKYTPAGGRVDIGATARETTVEIAVRDTGQGIAPEDLPHIFDRFYRADQARAAGGAGLGLSIAGWIVGEHGGQIRVQSLPGAGSVFTVTLPRAAVEEPAPPEPAPEEAAGRVEFLPDSEIALRRL
jgi:two-component system, OmpR family, sensor kinase